MDTAAFESIGKTPKQKKKSKRSTDLLKTMLFFAVSIGIGLIFVWIHIGWERIAATPLLWALACLASGAAIGFLFGIPKILQSSGPATGRGTAQPIMPQPVTTQPVMAQPADSPPSPPLPSGAASYAQRVNTNLEEISDWLTKIIVGLGLVNLAKLPAALQHVANILAVDIGPPTQNAFALALIVYFSVTGFLSGYLITRLFLQRALADADISVINVGNALNQAVDQATRKAFAADPEAGKFVTLDQVHGAQQVAQIAQQGDISLVRQKIWDLAQEYEQTRATLPSGDPRTRQMEIIVTKMRTLAIAANSLLPELTMSLNPGQRLFAVAILQVNPSPDYIDWLAARLSVEKPFIGYHASAALVTAVRTLDVSFKQKLLDAIAAAKEGLQKSAFGQSVESTDRYRMLDQAAKELQPNLSVGKHF